MRSPREIAFRLRQEGGNLFRLIHPPHTNSVIKPPLAGLPDSGEVAAGLAGTPYASEIMRLAEGVSAYRFPLLSYQVEAGPRIEWRGDYVNRVSSGVEYFRRIPYPDFAMKFRRANSVLASRRACYFRMAATAKKGGGRAQWSRKNPRR